MIVKVQKMSSQRRADSVAKGYAAKRRLENRGFFYKKTTSSYTGSPDSDEVANSLKQFTYNPEKSQNILQKYAQIIEKTM